MVQPALFFEPGPFPGLPGPTVGREGPKIGQKPGAGFIILSPLRPAQPVVEGDVQHGGRNVLHDVVAPILRLGAAAKEETAAVDKNHDRQPE